MVMVCSSRGWLGMQVVGMQVLQCRWRAELDLAEVVDQALQELAQRAPVVG
jgi:hypothetical protein